MEEASAGRIVTYTNPNLITAVEDLSKQVSVLKQEFQASEQKRRDTDPELIAAILDLNKQVSELKAEWKADRMQTAPAKPSTNQEISSRMGSLQELLMEEMAKISTMVGALSDSTQRLQEQTTLSAWKEAFHLRLNPGEKIVVFDCGADTIDICILEVGVEGGGLSFSRKALVGFPFGASLIDELLANAAWEHWASIDANLNPQPKATAATAKQTKKSFPPQDYTVAGIRITRSHAVPILREIREELHFPPSNPNQDEMDFDAFLDPDYYFPVNWKMIRSLFKPYLDMILTQDNGIPAGTEIPNCRQPNGITTISEMRKSLKAILWEAQIDLDDMKQVFLPDWGNMMPFFCDALKEYFPGASIHIVPDTKTWERLRIVTQFDKIIFCPV